MDLTRISDSARIWVRAEAVVMVEPLDLGPTPGSVVHLDGGARVEVAELPRQVERMLAARGEARKIEVGRAVSGRG